MEIHVDQAGQGEGVGGGEVRLKRRVSLANVVKDRCHDALIPSCESGENSSCSTSRTLDFAGWPCAVYYIRVPERVPVGPIAQ